jgi:hypothetical protein
MPPSPHFSKRDVEKVEERPQLGVLKVGADDQRTSCGVFLKKRFL